MTSRQVCAAFGRRFPPRTLGAARIGLEMGRPACARTVLVTSVPHITRRATRRATAAHPGGRHEGHVAATNALRGDIERPTRRDPAVLFTTPAVGLVGMAYGEAPAHGIQPAVARQTPAQQPQRRHR